MSKLLMFGLKFILRWILAMAVTVVTAVVIVGIFILSFVMIGMAADRYGTGVWGWSIFLIFTLSITIASFFDKDKHVCEHCKLEAT